jgi:uncharacterized protein YndB with AHSA1/START domain
MTTTEKINITVEAIINAPVEKVWDLWTDPKHIIQWNNASAEWHTPKAENDLRVGGKFLSRMEAKDGSLGFDFNGEYTAVDQHRLIEYTLGDERRVKIIFTPEGSNTRVTETFEAESTFSEDMQRMGWQAILDNFKKYAETQGKFEKLHFDVLIDAPVETVYDIMLDEKNFAEWTAEFNPSSHYKGSWEKGSKILFIGCDKDGTKGGMVSRINENIPNKFVSIEHLGLVQGEDEILSGPQVDGWAGALENYTFTEKSGSTLLSVDMDANEEFKSYFLTTWPKALNKLKGLCEA